MEFFKNKEEKEQVKAESLGLAETTERRIEDIGKPVPIHYDVPKAEKRNDHCVVDGCFNLKAPGQTHVCTGHVRAG